MVAVVVVKSIFVCVVMRVCGCYKIYVLISIHVCGCDHVYIVMFTVVAVIGIDLRSGL